MITKYRIAWPAPVEFWGADRLKALENCGELADNGASLLVAKDDFERLRKEVFNSKMTGLGDLIGKVATPIAAAIGLPCVDTQTKELKPDSPCAQRKSALNEMFPFKPS